MSQQWKKEEMVPAYDLLAASNTGASYNDMKKVIMAAKQVHCAHTHQLLCTTHLPGPPTDGEVNAIVLCWKLL
jgi:hypothetical protein